MSHDLCSILREKRQFGVEIRLQNPIKIELRARYTYTSTVNGGMQETETHSEMRIWHFSTRRTRTIKTDFITFHRLLFTCNVFQPLLFRLCEIEFIFELIYAKHCPYKVYTKWLWTMAPIKRILHLSPSHTHTLTLANKHEGKLANEQTSTIAYTDLFHSLARSFTRLHSISKVLSRAFVKWKKATKV